MPDRGAPRLLTRGAMRAYCGGVSWAAIADRIARGQLPGPLWGLPADHKEARWDRRAVDRALDAASGVPATLDQQTLEMDRALGLA